MRILPSQVQTVLKDEIRRTELHKYEPLIQPGGKYLSITSLFRDGNVTSVLQDIR
jgi:hypothetical protein